MRQETITRKEYPYAIGITTLKFTLRQDNDQELVPFKAMLEAALVDVTADLEALRLKRKQSSKK